MRGWILLGAAVATLTAAACSDDETAPARDPSSSGTGTGTSTGTSSGTSTGTSSGTGTGTGGPEVPICLEWCATPGDCGVSSTPAFDADNYECPDGICVYLGCHTGAECLNQVCRPDAQSGVSFCVPPCGTASDCSMGLLPFDTDNYACTDGGCQYLGCNDDTECMALGDFVCRDAGAGTTLCVSSCTAVADCDTGAGMAYDEDNYSCPDDFCLYTGCVSDAECMAGGDFVCAGL